MSEQNNQPEQQERESQPVLEPRVWIGCLAAYNDGVLHGEWVNAAVLGEELVTAAQRIVATSPEPLAEEWAVFDYDNFGEFRVREYDQLEHIARVARGIAEHGHPFSAWAELHDGEESMLAGFEDAYLGEYDSPEDWARGVMADLDLDRSLEHLPETIRSHIQIDYARWARDAELSGDIHLENAPAGRTYVFLIR